MKNILRWLFEERMRDLEMEAIDHRIDMQERFEKNHVAESKLRELGYKLVFVGGTIAEPYGSPTRNDFRTPRWDLIKIEANPSQ